MLHILSDPIPKFMAFPVTLNIYPRYVQLAMVYQESIRGLEGSLKFKPEYFGSRI